MPDSGLYWKISMCMNMVGNNAQSQKGESNGCGWLWACMNRYERTWRFMNSQNLHFLSWSTYRSALSYQIPLPWEQYGDRNQNRQLFFLDLCRWTKIYGESCTYLDHIALGRLSLIASSCSSAPFKRDCIRTSLRQVNSKPSASSSRRWCYWLLSKGET